MDPPNLSCQYGGYATIHLPKQVKEIKDYLKMSIRYFPTNKYLLSNERN